MGKIQKSVLVKGVRDNKIPKQRIKQELETKMDTKRMQELYIHNMVLVEHIIWLRERKKKEAKEEGKRRGKFI